MKNLILFTCIFIVFFSCKKFSIDSVSSTQNSNYLVFGHYHLECGGESCIEIFRLESNQLLEDTLDSFPNARDFYKGDFIKLSAQKYNAAKDLIGYFPLDLLKEPNNVLGQPDATDLGGIYVEYNYFGIKKFWLLDKTKYQVPRKYHKFIDKINEKIKLIW